MGCWMASCQWLLFLVSSHPANCALLLPWSLFVCAWIGPCCWPDKTYKPPSRTASPFAGPDLNFTPAIQALGPHVAPLGMVSATFFDLERKCRACRTDPFCDQQQYAETLCWAALHTWLDDLHSNCCVVSHTLRCRSLACAALLPLVPRSQLPQAVQPRHLHRPGERWRLSDEPPIRPCEHQPCPPNWMRQPT